MIDPLSVATEGYFTHDSMNSSPITKATQGFILFGVETGGSGGIDVRVMRTPRYYPEPREKTQKTTEVFDGIEIEETRTVLVQEPPLKAAIKPISEIIADQALIRELRVSAILQHQKKEMELRLLNEQKLKLYKKRKHLLLMIMLDEI